MPVPLPPSADTLSSAADDSRGLVTLLHADQDRRWRQGERFRAEDEPGQHSGPHLFLGIAVFEQKRPAEAERAFRRPVDLHFGADGHLHVLVRDAWVVDRSFKGDTGALLRARYTGK